MSADYLRTPVSGQFDNEHDRSSRLEMARRLADLCSGVSNAELDRITCFDADGNPKSYHIPRDTLTVDEARALCILGENDLFGGVVPFRFVATKAVGHRLVPGARAIPHGWDRDLGNRLSGTVLSGFSAFDLTDAQAAGASLLAAGPIRVKQVEATAGRGQTVVRTLEELESALGLLDPETVRREGVVLEENLLDVKTYSIGSARILDRSIAYWGTQAITVNREGETVYGGTCLHAVRGGLADLASREFPAELREAIKKARDYDRKIFGTFPQMFASRRNYDVAVGTDHRGQRRIGVLEQSWRVGGATPAEIAALERFEADPARNTAVCTTVEIHGDDNAAPVGAIIYYAGIDPIAGPMTKYVMVME
ncbi:DUF3182 family protein (plasmid) [Novosphingobium sp. BL-8A]|uniref:DUF3182 family protein n=1 Tax=Novosphingobium sp. BL-8A TaxID=3127639 RepID=UPI003756881B